MVELTTNERKICENAEDLFHDKENNLAGAIFQLVPGLKIVPYPEKPHPDFPRDELALAISLINGLCQSEEEKRISGQVKPPTGFPYLILGHEWVGILAEPANGLPAGTLVISAVRLPCSHAGCVGFETCMDTDKYLSFGSTRCHGGLGRVVLVPKKALVPLQADGRSLRYGFYGEALAVTNKLIANAVQVSNRNRLVRVGVVGIGGIGLPELYWLSQWENAQLFAFDIKPAESAIAKAAERLGATYVSVDKDGMKELRGSLDYVVEASGDPKAFLMSLQLLRNKGRLDYLSLPSERRDVVLPGEALREATLKELNIQFSVGFGMSHLKAAAESFPSFCDAIGLDLLQKITLEIPFSTLSDESIEAARSTGAKVFIRMQE
jgi:threonine dehydrogenase-like Zn-dependent dehydrogenase